VPTAAVVWAMILAPGDAGRPVFVAAKMWLLLLPAFWFLVVERGRPSLSPLRRGGLFFGAASGLVIAGAIVAAYVVIGPSRVDPGLLHAAVVRMGLEAPARFLLAAAGWTLLNSLMEEIFYRWFVLVQCRRLLPPAWAVVASASIFTVHHVVALQVYLSPGLTALASAGVLTGGLMWAWCYHRYRSIWPGWVSHVLADVAVFAIGWHLLFG